MRFILIIFCFLNINLFSQTYFLETFDEVNGSTSGVDNSINNVGWNASCPSCVSGDYFEVKTNSLEANDTNGPATFQTNQINTSGCGLIEITFDISEIGTMEGCGTGCNSVDWVQLEYNIDNSGWQTPGNSYFCAGTCASLNVIQSDDITGGSIPYASDCFVAGNTLEIRINLQCWAGTEYWVIDNIRVECSSCALPIELIEFNGYSNNQVNVLNWVTASEINNDYFTLEKSRSGIYWEEIVKIDGAGNSNTITSYEYVDQKPFPQNNYYRLKQTDFDGNSEYFKIIYINKSINENKKLIKIVNMLGQTVNKEHSGIGFYIYDNGEVFKTTKIAN
jgi:hypothetical protein